VERGESPKEDGVESDDELTKKIKAEGGFANSTSAQDTNTGREILLVILCFSKFASVFPANQSIDNNIDFIVAAKRYLWLRS